MLAVHMLHEGGSLADGSVVTQADPVQFEAWIVEGSSCICAVFAHVRYIITCSLLLFACATGIGHY